MNPQLATVLGAVYLCVDVAAGLVGGLLLAYHGHIEDSGSRPVNSLPYALIWFVQALALALVAVRVLMTKRPRAVRIGGAIVLLMALTWLALYELRWEPFSYYQGGTEGPRS